MSASEGAVARGMVYALDEVAERAPLPLTYCTYLLCGLSLVGDWRRGKRLRGWDVKVEPGDGSSDVVMGT